MDRHNIGPVLCSTLTNSSAMESLAIGAGWRLRLRGGPPWFYNAPPWLQLAGCAGDALKTMGALARSPAVAAVGTW